MVLSSHLTPHYIFIFRGNSHAVDTDSSLHLPFPRNFQHGQHRLLITSSFSEKFPRRSTPTPHYIIFILREFSQAVDTASSLHLEFPRNVPSGRGELEIGLGIEAKCYSGQQYNARFIFTSDPKRSLYYRPELLCFQPCCRSWTSWVYTDIIQQCTGLAPSAFHMVLRTVDSNHPRPR